MKKKKKEKKSVLHWHLCAPTVVTIVTHYLFLPEMEMGSFWGVWTNEAISSVLL